MFEYSENNHYRWRWDNQGLYTLPSDINNQQFIFSIGRCSRSPMNFRDECIYAAKKIYTNSKNPIRVLLSGGFDSQVVFLSFIMANIDFEALIIRTVDEYGEYVNDFDTSAAFELCSKFNKDPEIAIVKWYNALDNARNSPEYLYKNFIVPNAHFLTKKFSDYCLILGTGPHDRHYYLKSPDLVFSENPCQPCQYGMDHGNEIITFFMYTPELWLSMVDSDSMSLFRKALPSMEAAMTHYMGSTEFMNKSSHYGQHLTNDWWKPLLFCEQWPEIIQRTKYHGYEVAYSKSPEKVIEYMKVLIDPTKELVSNKSISVPIQEMIDYMKSSGPVKEWVSK